MPQPDEFEMGRRSPSTRSPTERSTHHYTIHPTETVHIQVNPHANKSFEDVEKTLKRGLEARQVSVRLVRCMKLSKVLSDFYDGAWRCVSQFRLSMSALSRVHSM